LIGRPEDSLLDIVIRSRCTEIHDPHSPAPLQTSVNDGGVGRCDYYNVDVLKT
jgi:hypothetical protein